MSTKRELGEAFEQGRRFERRQRLLFQGVRSVGPWTRGVTFTANGSWFESCTAYERDLRNDRRRVQRSIWTLRQDDAESALDVQALVQVEAVIETELCKARKAVDEELRGGNAPPYAVAAMRAAAQRPPHVIEFPQLARFIAQDEHRAIGDWPHRHDAGGADFGFDWQLENPFRRWERTRWRVSWLCENEEPTHEVYALESLPNWNGKYEHRSGRVWLLGKLSDWTQAEKTLGVLQRHAQHERNSLAVAAQVVRAAARGESVEDLARRLALESS